MDTFNDIFFIQKISEELSFSPSRVKAVIKLLQEGNTIPFIARYRKEMTENLNEVDIKNIQERFEYLKELEDRRQTILASIEGQGKLTDDLKQQILACDVKTSLEDLYLPYKPKRRTRAMIAREKGLEPLAQHILEQSLQNNILEIAKSYIDLEKGINDTDSALAGARDIVAEIVAENSEARRLIREIFAEEGIIISKVCPGKEKEPTKFEQYYDFKESIKTIPSHRYLAIRRGEREEILDLSITIEAEPAIRQLEQLFKLNSASSSASQLHEAIEDSFYRLISPSIETDVRLELKQNSDQAAVAVFADNLRHLLLAAPLGEKTVIGIDPGIRTGCKCAVVDSTGKYLTSKTFYLSQGNHSLEEAKQILSKLIVDYKPIAIAIGNGTAGRETEAFVRALLKENNTKDLWVVPVNESGASIYSASEVAREEFPDLDLTIRGAISIARRLQDPLAELVKIDPKSIGVGQYQHDVHQPLLHDQLKYVVESCVNRVGVDLNMASASLLSYVSGIGPSLAKKIVKFRETHGAFKNRKNIQNIPGFGSKTFEQSAGFLRIFNGENPLDASAVHPESYAIVEKMAQDLGVSIYDLMKNPALTSKIQYRNYTNQSGEFTIVDIIEELKKPGRDPRANFEPPAFREDIQTLEDLKPGLRLEGVVTNVTAFGAFVDIGVHQDGLVHISELSHQFIKHPNEVVAAGQKIAVEVLNVDIKRKRIFLTAKIGEKKQKQVSKQPQQPFGGRMNL